MNGLAEWARDLLLSRGALVESEEGARVRALLPPEVAASLDTGEWLALNFDGRAGADEASDWIERLAHLLPSGLLVSGARLPRLSSASSVDTGAVLARELVVQNGIYRMVEDFSGNAQYLLFTFEYTVESDERSTGLVRICLNASARSQPPQTQLFWSALQGAMEGTPIFSRRRGYWRNCFRLRHGARRMKSDS